MSIQPSLREVLYDGRVMITETDPKGIITFANRKFIEMTGYGTFELIGNSHNIVRHPDMPGVCFNDMWTTLRGQDSWQGYVKNLRKDGAFYWVIVHINPKIENGSLVGYIAARKKPDREIINKAEIAYQKAKDLERKGEHKAAAKLIGDFRHINVSRFPSDQAV